MLLTYSRLVNNHAVSCGGISTGGTIFLINSTVAGNRAGSLGGGGICTDSALLISNSTIAENQAQGGPGGGIYNRGGTVHLINSTLAGNTGLFGGGIWNSAGTVTLTNSTLAYNRADGTSSVVCGGGGGLCNSGGPVTLQNAILAHNTALSGPDCRGLVTSQGNNVLGDPTSCTLTLQASDHTGDPGVGDFADAGVSGRGHVPLRPDSPAIDAGNTEACAPTDQLGNQRDGHCDIGAVAFQQALAAFVTAFYQVPLGRDPSPSEVASWMGFLQADPTLARAGLMSHAIFDGAEYLARPETPWSHVSALYEALLGRTPDAAGLDWWVGVLLDQRNMALPAFIDTPEFHSLVPDCREVDPLAALVTRLFEEVLGRMPSADEVIAWTNYLLATCDIEGVAMTFFNASEYLRVPRTLADQVTILYQALLAREPTAEEEALWVTALAGQLGLLEDGFIASTEFQARWQQLFP